MNKKVLCIILSCMLLLMVGCSKEPKQSTKEEVQSSKISFKDDLGKEIVLDQPAQKIISLYSAHTENLFALGLDDEVIGVGSKDDYPSKAKEKDKFDYRSDPEKVIATGADAVLIRPFIKKSKPEFVQALENAGINVVCLYPESFDEFDEYIEKLGKLTGKEENAKKRLEEFHQKLNDIHKKTEGIESKVNVYFESTENEYRTITVDSMAAKALMLAGGKNVATDAKPIREGTSIASYGDEKILQKADQIDVYVGQKGRMNASVTADGIKSRPGFDTIKAVKNNRVYVIDEKIISGPTFRFAEGVESLAKMFYPDLFEK